MLEDKTNADKNNIRLDQGTINWLKSDQGIIQLGCAWKTALWLLTKESAKFGSLEKEYKSLKSDGRLVGMNFSEDIKIEMINLSENDDSFEPENSSYPEVKQVNFHVEFFLYIDPLLKENWECIDDDDKRNLSNILWKEMSINPELRQDQQLTFKIIDNYEEETDKDTDNREFKWIKEATSSYVHSSAQTIFNTSIRLISLNELSSITEKKLIEISRILWNNKVNINSNLKDSKKYSIDNPYRFRSFDSSRIESVLAKYLLASGFLVVLEPDMVLPELSTYRKPDLLVISKGRTIAVEIDSEFHLTQAKWSRDRALDQAMLCNGIPLLRVWVSEVDENPEIVMTKILQIFESLGGKRMIYD